jgi:dUTP pyrophosphatase
MEKEFILKIKKIGKDVEIPGYNLKSDVGFDLKANEDATLSPGEQKQIKTGLIAEIPEGCVGLIRDRIGIVTKLGIHTAAGTFDSGFRGEISIVLVNYADETVEIEKGMRIAQMILLPVIKAKIKEVKELNKTERGSKIGISKK